MLYHHLRMARQTSEYRAMLRPILPKLVDVDPFFPEVARRLAEPTFTRKLQHPSPEQLRAFFEEPTEMLVDMMRASSVGNAPFLRSFLRTGAVSSRPFRSPMQIGRLQSASASGILRSVARSSV